MRYDIRRKIYPLLLSVILLLVTFTSITKAAPLTQSFYPECPPNVDSIWVQVNDNDFGTDEVVQIPFDAGEAVVNGNIYVNYLLGVLLAEIGPSIDFDPVDDETMKAMAILARTVAYRNCGCEIIANNTDCSLSFFPDSQNIYHRGVDDSAKQQYNPTRRDNFDQTELARYQQAIDATDGIYLTYENGVFDAQYRNISGEWTADYDQDGDGTIEPHKQVYDSAGKFHNGENPGFPQVNANHYATGQNHTDYLPPYDYLRLLNHYLTGIKLEKLSYTPNIEQVA